MDLLYMPLLDLQQHLKQELLNNPFLDMVEPEEEDEEERDRGERAERRSEPEKEENDDEIDWEEILLDGFDAGGRREEHEEQRVLRAGHGRHAATCATTCATRSRCSTSTPRQMLLADEFIGNINEDGYLACPLEEILDGVNEMRRARPPRKPSATSTTCRSTRWPKSRRCSRIIQSLDPPGVGARDLRECLCSSSREAGLEQSVPYRLVRDCFDELINHRWSEISKRFGISAGRRAEGRRRDREARSQAGPRATASASDNYIIPDLIVDKIDGQYHVFLNDANLPRLKLSRAYQEIARDKKKFDGENKEFISNKLNSANWMIQAIEQRRQTMLKVMNYIVDRQRDFFEKGVQYLKPLTLREVAEVINMHESTVSRVTNEKFVQTPRGVLPLKFFFSSGLSTTAGEDVSARGIKAQIEKLVSRRGPEAPAHRSGDRQHPQGERRADRAPHRRQVPRPARRPLGADAQAGMTAIE